LALQDFYRGDILFVTHDLAQGYKLGSRIAVYEGGRLVQIDNKDRVISRPANRTAARLTGYKNLLEGRVNHVDSAGVLVDVTGLGASLWVAPEGNTGLAAGQKVVVGIRSEHVRPGALVGENTIDCTVIRIVEGVTTRQYFIRPAGSGSESELEVSLSKTEKSDMLNGVTYHFNLPPEHLVIIA
jgi:molybdate transport system ATP-binding protein